LSSAGPVGRAGAGGVGGFPVAARSGNDRPEERWFPCGGENANAVAAMTGTLAKLG